MTQPVRFSITVDFSDDEVNNVGGRSTVKTASLDALFVNIKSSIDQICNNLALIQRDDTLLMDGSVRLHTLSPEVRALMASTAFVVQGAWMTATVYAKGAVVLQAGIIYVCIVAHTSGTFVTDLANGLWGQLTANATAAATTFSPTATIAASNVQAAIAELDSETRPVQSILVHDLFGAL